MKQTGKSEARLQKSTQSQEQKIKIGKILREVKV